MKMFFVFMLLAISLVNINQAMALPSLDQTLIFNEDASGEAKDKNPEEKNPEDDCE